MNHRPLILLVLLSLFCGGCALLPPGSGTPAPVVEIADSQQVVHKLRGQARILRYRGRYAEAIQHLDRAIALHPENSGLLEERTQTQLSWSRLQFELQDRLQLIEASARTERLPLLERLVQTDPADETRRSQLQTLRRELQQDAAALAECGRRQADARQDLARRCLRLSIALAAPKGEDRALLARLEKKLRPGGGKSRNKPKPAIQDSAPAAQIESPQPPPPELLKARQLMQDGKHFGAIRHLKKLQESGRDTPGSRAMLNEAQEALAANTNALLQAGDRLYHQGRVKEALALWDAALTADPYNQDARSKSERAARVLSNLEALGGQTSAP